MDTSNLLSGRDPPDRGGAMLEPLLPPESPVGRPRLHSLRIIRTAIFYELRTGGAWRVLPPAWPPWKTVEHDGRKGRPGATGERPHTALRERLRGGLGREPPPPPGPNGRQTGESPRGGGQPGA